MNADTQNSVKQMLQDILEKFLGKEEFAKLIEQLFATSVLPLNTKESLTGLDREQINYELDYGFCLGSQIDLLITFTELNLPSKEFFQFLLELGQLSITSGELRLASDVHEKIIREAGKTEDFSEITANALLAQGKVYVRQANWDLSSKYAQMALVLFEKTANRNGKAKCENLLGNIKGDCGDLEGAKFHYKNSLSCLKDEEDINLIASLESNIGIICNIQGLFDESLNYFTSALHRLEKLNKKERIAVVLHNIGMMYLQNNNYQAAIDEFNKSIAVSTETNNIPCLGMSYLSKAYLYSKLHDHLLATAYADKALSIFNKINDKLSIAEIYKVKGIINKNLGNYSLSESYFLTSLRINSELSNSLNQAESSYELGLLYKEEKRNEDAKKYFAAAKDYYLKINSKKEADKIEKEISALCI